MIQWNLFYNASDKAVKPVLLLIGILIVNTVGPVLLSIQYKL